jgi:hypothetical protein
MRQITAFLVSAVSCILSAQNPMSFQSETGKFGFKDSFGSVVIQPRYDGVSDFMEVGLSRVKMNNKYGFIDKHGMDVIPITYDYAAKFFHRGLVAVNIGCAPPSYESLSMLLGNLAMGGKWGFLDKAGTEVTPIKYDDVGALFLEGLVQVKVKEKWGFIDTTGTEVITVRYDDVRYFCDGSAEVKLNGKWGFIDKYGKEIIPIEYDKVSSNCSGGWAGNLWVQLNGKWGLVNKTGQEITPLKFDEVNAYGDGIAEVKLKNKVGYIDSTGRIVLPIKYGFAQFIIDTIILVNDGDSLPQSYRGPPDATAESMDGKINIKWGLVKIGGQEIIPTKYDNIEQVDIENGIVQGLIPVSIGGSWKMMQNGSEEMDSQGNIVSVGISPGYLGGKWGFVNLRGEEVVPIKYDAVETYNSGKAKVKLNGRQFYIDKKGNEVRE